MAKKNNSNKETEIKEEIKTVESYEEELVNFLNEQKENITSEISTKVDEQIELQVSKRMKEEERRIVRGKTGKIIRRDLFIIILIAVIGYFGYCLYKVDYFNIRIKPAEPTPNIKDSEPSKEEPKKDNEEPSEPIIKDEHDTEYYLKNYGYLLDNININDESIFKLYQGKINLENIPNELVLKIAYKNLSKETINTDNNMITFNSEALLNSATKVFGSNIYLKHELFNYNSTKFMYYNDTYIGLKEPENKIGFISKVSEAKEENNKLTFKVVVAKLTEENQLINNLNELVIENYQNENILDYQDKLSTFEVTFTYNIESNNYSFTSIEEVLT